MINYKIKTFSDISSKGLEVLSDTCCALDEKSKDPDGLLVRSTKIDKGVLNSRLKAISRAGVGVNNIPIDICSERGIAVFNTPGANANAVKELVLAALMLSSRNVFSSIDFVVVPGLAFDAFGNRVGYGGGFYDKVFKKITKNATRVAIGFGFQLFDLVPHTDLDEPVHFLITEVTTLRCRGAYGIEV
mgnify:CR=1 FL=1